MWRTRCAGCWLLLVLCCGQRPSAGFGMNILHPLGADSDWDVCLCIFAYTPTWVIKQHFNSSASCLCSPSPIMASFISLPFVLAVFLVCTVKVSVWVPCTVISRTCWSRDQQHKAVFCPFFFQFFSAECFHTQTFLALLWSPHLWASSLCLCFKNWPGEELQRFGGGWSHSDFWGKD